MKYWSNKKCFEKWIVNKARTNEQLNDIKKEIKEIIEILNCGGVQSRTNFINKITIDACDLLGFVEHFLNLNTFPCDIDC